MANAWARDRAGWFYYGFGLCALAAVAVGFSTTYIVPMAQRSYVAPLVVHLHGALCLAWVLLFIAQSALVRGRHTPWHRRMGQAGVPIALGILVTGMGTAYWATTRDLGKTAAASANMIGTLTSLALFAGFVVFAVVMRRRPDWHKRLMMLATIVVIWPAVFRFRHLLPFVPRPDIWLALVLADVPILIAAVRDRLRYGRVHPVWAIFGTLLVVEQSLETLILFGSSGWNEIGAWIYHVLS